MIGNLFSDKSTDKQKDNLIVFLTPHIVRTKSELRDLALDERQEFVNSLGRKEIHDMPASQIRQSLQAELLDSGLARGRPERTLQRSGGASGT